MDESAADICIGCRTGISGIQCECCGQAEKGNKEGVGCLFFGNRNNKECRKESEKGNGR